MSSKLLIQFDETNRDLFYSIDSSNMHITLLLWLITTATLSNITQQ